MTIDSNILIRYLNGDGEVIHQLNDWFASRRSLTISTISMAEVLAWKKLSKTDTEIAREFLDRFFVVPVNQEIASEGARLRRQYAIALLDALIAATALVFDMPLVTRDQAMRRVKELRFVQL